MSLFNTAFTPSKDFLEGIVTSVDPDKFLCDVKTFKGQRLQGVSWLMPTGGGSEGGSQYAPNLKDRVLVTTSTSYPLIIGVIPHIGPVDAFSPSIGSGMPPTSQGSPTTLSGGFQSNTGKPVDFTAGDHLQTNRTGGMVGLLREGTAILRAGSLAQIIVSRWDDLVRVVGRNFERISDFSTETVTNLYGRLYRFYGFNRNLSQSYLGVYEYTEIEGDVAAGEYGKDTPFGLPKPVPAANSFIRKKHLKANNGSGTDLMVETLNQSGELILTVTNSAGASAGNSVRTFNNGEIQDMVSGGGVNASITITPTSIIVNYNGVSTATFNATEVLLNFNNISKGTFTATSARLDSNSHFAVIDSTGVHLG